MSTALYTQTNRPLAVSTVLGPDALLLEGFRGTEGVSSLYQFTLDLLAQGGQEIPFEQVLGSPFSVKITDNSGTPRYFHGICSRFREGRPVRGPKGAATFVRYQAEMVPQVWLATRNVQSRIFQHMNVVDILKIVLQGVDLNTSRLHGDFLSRTYCTQYRESDFAFASRLMEEEGIAFHFEHTEKSHTLVLTNDNAGFPQLAEDQRTLELRLEDPAARIGVYIHSWEKAQAICAGKFTLRDHSFELPHSDLEERLPLCDNVAVGTVKHALKLPVNENLEVFEYPAGHAAYFDEIDRDGTPRPEELDKVRQDAERRTKLRMEQEAAEAMHIEAASNSAHCEAGYKIAVKRGEPLGLFLMTRVDHEARLSGSYGDNGDIGLVYENRFECIPDGLKYRPPSRTPRPRIQGTQTAVVVGPEAGGIFTDKYGRVKVQFHWDRQGKKDIDSSCWIRVLQPWAGQGWGSLNLPRAGQEVVVDFLEGDPDRPIILGSVYNAEQMPPYALPDERARSGIKSRSLLSANPEHFNEIRLDDTAGAEKFIIAAQKDLSGTVENDYTLNVSNDSTIQVGKDQTITVDGKQTETIDGNNSLHVGTGPLTMNFTIDWNNVEINKLTKSVVTGVVSDRVSGAEARAALAGSLSVVSGLSTDLVLGKRIEATLGSYIETISGAHKTTVGKSTTMSSRFKLNMEGKHSVLIEGGGAGGVQNRSNGFISLKQSVRGKPGSIEAKGYNIRLISADAQDQIMFSLKEGVQAVIQAGTDPNNNKIELAEGAINLVVDLNNYIMMTAQGIVIKTTQLEFDIDTRVTHQRTQTQVV